MNKKQEPVTLETVIAIVEASAEKVIKKVTEDLTQVIQDAVGLCASKSDFQEFKEEMYEFKQETKETLYNLDLHAKKTDQRLDKIEKIIEPIPKMWEATQQELRKHDKRITYLEQHKNV